MQKPKRPKKAVHKRELRVFTTPQHFEVRANGDGTRSISGYFAVFNSLSSDLGGFVERIQPGAFSQSLKDNSDILAYYNHNPDLVLGRVSSGTLTVSEDNKGLRFKVTLPKTSYADDLITLMERKDVSACSFAFGTIEDDWEMVGNQLIRTLISVRLFEGSIVGNPAYPSAVADLRSCPTQLRSKLRKDVLDDIINDDDDDSDEDEDDENRCLCQCDACRAAHPDTENDQDTSDRAAHLALLTRRAR